MTTKDFMEKFSERWETENKYNLSDIKNYVEKSSDRDKLFSLLRNSWRVTRPPRVADLIKLATEHNIPITSIDSRKAYFRCEKCKTKWTVDMDGHCPQCKVWTPVTVVIS